MARGMKVTDDYKPMSTCGKACHNSAVCTIAIINVIDFCLGGIFIAFAVYLYSKLGDNFMNPNTAWLGWCCAILGILLILVVLTSFCAITSMGCRWVMAPSRMFALVVALLAIALGSAAFGLQPKFFHYLDDHGNEDGLSDSDITLVKNWFLTVAIGAFGVAVIEVIRFKLSQSFRENALELDNEFDNLLEQNAKDWNNKIATNQADREEKYNDLRSYYKAKYNTNPK